MLVRRHDRLDGGVPRPKAGVRSLCEEEEEQRLVGSGTKSEERLR